MDLLDSRKIRASQVFVYARWRRKCRFWSTALNGVGSQAYFCRALHYSGVLRGLDDDFSCLQAFVAFLHAVFNGLAFAECSVAFALYDAIVHKDILSVFSSNEAIAFGIVEPLDVSGFHFRNFYSHYVAQ